MVKGDYAKNRTYFKKYMKVYMTEIYNKIPKHKEENKIRVKKYKLKYPKTVLAYQKKWWKNHPNYAAVRRERFRKDDRCTSCGKLKVDSFFANCIECRGGFLK